MRALSSNAKASESAPTSGRHSTARRGDAGSTPVRADPPFLVRLLDPDAKLSTIIKAGRALSPSGEVAIRWVLDERSIIVGVDLVEAGR